MKKRVNKLEKAFDKWFQDKERKDLFFVHNQPDIPPLFSKQLRFKPKQLPDRLVLSKILRAYYLIEIKETSGSRFDFNRLKDHQEKSLIEFDKKAGLSYILMCFNEFEKVVLIHIHQFLKLKNIVKKEAKNGERRGEGKSFTIDDLEKIKYQLIPAKKMKVNYKIDLSCLLPDQMVITSFI